VQKKKIYGWKEEEIGEKESTGTGRANLKKGSHHFLINHLRTRYIDLADQNSTLRPLPEKEQSCFVGGEKKRQACVWQRNLPPALARGPTPRPVYAVSFSQGPPQRGKDADLEERIKGLVKRPRVRIADN